MIQKCISQLEENKFRERFEKRENCIPLAIDYVYFFFTKNYLPIQKVGKCKNLIDIYKVFDDNNFWVQCQCHPIFLKNYRLKHLVNKSFQLTKNLTVPPIVAIITYSSAYEMYGITDFWKHCVVEVIKYEKWTLYDSYHDFIFDDYNGLLVNKLTSEKLQEIKKFSLVIWRK